jgi:hypothetical protein
MQMHQIRYFLALCEELSFTRAARRIGVSQPSLTNAIGALERELGGALFQRRPLIAPTALGNAMRPYLERIAENADQACATARTLLHMRRASSEPASVDGISQRTGDGWSSGNGDTHDMPKRNLPTILPAGTLCLAAGAAANAGSKPRPASSSSSRRT